MQNTNVSILPLDIHFSSFLWSLGSSVTCGYRWAPPETNSSHLKTRSKIGRMNYPEATFWSALTMEEAFIPRMAGWSTATLPK